MTDKLNRAALNELFGRAIMAKLIRGHGSYSVSKHHPAHRCKCEEHPPGTKLVRRFIRRGRGENVYYRQLYAIMAGHQYQRAA